MSPELRCKQCSKPFSVPPYRRSTALYCSRRCQALGQRTKIKAKCSTCGSEFEHISSRANAAKYCSRACYYKAQHLKGTVIYACRHCHKKFRGAPSQKRVYCSRACVNKESAKTWRAKPTTVRKVMKRRGLIRSCERCGYSKEPRIIVVHHKDRNRRNNAPSNLEMLCPTCHALEHLPD